MAASPTLDWRAPQVTSIVSTFTAGLISLNVTFSPAASYPGRMYCAAFSNNVTITSVGQVVAAGLYAGYPFASSEASIAITGLSALSPYTTYCYFENSFGTGNSISEVLRTRRFHRTACCKDIVFTTGGKEGRR